MREKTTKPRRYTATHLFGGLLWLVAACDQPPSSATESSSSHLVPNDPLSTPAVPTLAVEDFQASSTCQGCHPEHVAQWRLSAHRQAIRDPVFNALQAIRRADLDDQEDMFCTQCHSPIGTRGGEITADSVFDDYSPVTQEGVTCEACHKVSALQREHNAGHVLDPNGPMRATLPSDAASPAHAVAQSSLHGESSFCAGCHDVIEGSGLALEQPFVEWLSSPAADDGVTCQGCHMPATAGQASVLGPRRDAVHDHAFVGVDIPLDGGDLSVAELDELDERIDALLAGSASLSIDAWLEGPELELAVTVTNRIAGHNLPTGSTFFRQMWLELVVTDRDGEQLYASGDLNEHGDLRDAWSDGDRPDDDLWVFHSTLFDEHGDPTPFPWRAHAMDNPAVPAGQSREKTYRIAVPSSASRPLRVQARLRFRAFAPWLLRAIGLGPLTSNVESRDIALALTTIAN